MGKNEPSEMEDKLLSPCLFLLPILFRLKTSAYSRQAIVASFTATIQRFIVTIELRI